jgi:hypothetical protein
MKAEERHELKSNELLHWIDNFPAWFEQNRNNILYVTVLIVVVIALYYYRWYANNVVTVREQTQLTALTSQVQVSKLQILQQQSQGNDVSYVLLKPADDLANLAKSTKNPNMAAIAFINRGEALRIELHCRLGAVSTEDKTSAINKAKESYSLAAEKAAKNPTLLAKAKLGLGLCEEELGNFDAAKQIYQDISSNTDMAQTPAAALAKERLLSMDMYKQQIILPAAPKVSQVQNNAQQAPIMFSADANKPAVAASPNNVSPKK